jgi:hypothetical protein
LEKRKNGIGKPSMKSPDSLAIANPSTLLWENEKINSEMMILNMHVKKHVTKIMAKDHWVSENTGNRIMDARKDSMTGNRRRDKMYPVFPTGVTDR